MHAFMYTRTLAHARTFAHELGIRMGACATACLSQQASQLRRICACTRIYACAHGHLRHSVRIARPSHICIRVAYAHALEYTPSPMGTCATAYASHTLLANTHARRIYACALASADAAHERFCACRVAPRRYPPAHVVGKRSHSRAGVYM